MPNSPLHHYSPPRSPVNRTLQDTQVRLKAEADLKHDTSSAEEVQTDKVIPEQNCLNAGASTSSATTPQSDQNQIPQKQVYYHPVRERVKRVKRIIESSSSSDSSSSNHQCSDDSWQLQSSPKRGKKYTKSIKTRRKKCMIMKRQSRIPPSSEKSREDESSSDEHPLRRVIIETKND